MSFLYIYRWPSPFEMWTKSVCKTSWFFWLQPHPHVPSRQPHSEWDSPLQCQWLEKARTSWACVKRSEATTRLATCKPSYNSMFVEVCVRSYRAWVDCEGTLDELKLQDARLLGCNGAVHASFTLANHPEVVALRTPALQGQEQAFKTCTLDHLTLTLTTAWCTLDHWQLRLTSSPVSRWQQ